MTTTQGPAATPPGALVPALRLRPDSAVHISPHTARGRAVDCPDANVEVTAVRWADETHRAIVLDYEPCMLFPGFPPRFRAGTVVYDRLTPVRLLWQGAA